MKKFFIYIILNILIYSEFSFSQIEQPYPPLNLVSIPTAGTIPRGSFTLESLAVKNGGLIAKLCVGFTDNFNFGVSYGIQNLIGNSRPSINKPTPEVQIKYRVFEESEIMPAIVYGLDTQGKGIFNHSDTVSVYGIDSTRLLNRYEQKAWGMYMVLSKNWNLFGNLGLHIGINKSLSENNDGDDDFNLFFGIDKEINRSFSLLIEYDAAFNDNLNYNNFNFNEITFGRGKGYLNAGIRWAISQNLMLEVDFNDISHNTSAEYTNRELKIIFSDIF